MKIQSLQDKIFQSEEKILILCISETLQEFCCLDYT